MTTFDRAALIERAAKAGFDRNREDAYPKWDDMSDAWQRDRIAEEAAALPVITKALFAPLREAVENGRAGFWEQDNHDVSSPDRVFGFWVDAQALERLLDAIEAEVQR